MMKVFMNKAGEKALNLSGEVIKSTNFVMKATIGVIVFIVLNILLAWIPMLIVAGIAGMVIAQKIFMYSERNNNSYLNDAILFCAKKVKELKIDEKFKRK